MAVEIKVAPDEKLELVQVRVEDTNPSSDYFNVSELPDTFSGGKNAFLIAGSEDLLGDTIVKIQIRDAEGNVVYNEFSNGSPNEYFEGNSKVVSVYVYPTDTAFGPATITIIGELKAGGLVRWTKQININPALPNTTRVRFYKRPKAEITEILQPLYSFDITGSKVASIVTQSFANIKVNQLETFAGDVARIKVYRTSAGDISDYELIQDIKVESKNLLTTYELSGSVVGNAGLFTSDSLSKLWLSSSLHSVLDSTYVDAGLQLTGSGTLTYSASLNLLSSNTYELELDAFYTGSTSNTLIVYISGSKNGAVPITTFEGIVPTKNFGTTTTAFKITNDEPTASLYLSQSSGTNQWHVGNISLNLSQDTAFSPNEISFITSMPTVLGNETFNFKFEFYDINNNYVPVEVTQSALFNGGNTNIGGTLGLISSSNTLLSQSVSNDLWFSAYSLTSSLSHSYSASVGYTAAASASLQSSSLYISSSLSSSISSSLSSSLNYTSGSIFTLSGSVSNSINLVSGSFSSSLSVVSGSVYNLSQSVSTSLASISSSVSNSAFSVYSASTYLQTFIFTDATGKLNKTPTTSSAVNGLYISSTYLGYYSGSDWKTYMDNLGHFYLTGSNSNFLAWDGSTLQVQGVINIQGGNAATTASLNAATQSLSQSAYGAFTSASSYSASISASTFATTNLLDKRIFTDVSGNINKPPNVLVGSSNGLYLGSTYLGFYSGSTWRTYMDNAGKFYLTGSVTNGYSNYLTWDGAGTLTVAGAINITGGNAATQDYAGSTASGSLTTATSRLNASSSTLQTNLNTSASTLQTNLNASSSTLQGNITTVDTKVFTDSSGRITKAPSTGTAGLFLGSSYLGYHDGSGTALGWKTYMSNTGNFYLTGSSAWLLWDAGAGTLNIQGSINITGGNAATKDYANTAADVSGSSYSTTALSTATSRLNASSSVLQTNITNVDNKTFTSTEGLINKAATPSGAGLYLGSSYMGYYNSSAWKTYMANNGDFYLSGTSGYLQWSAGADTLSIKGNITANTITANTAGTVAGWSIDANRFYKTVSGVGKVEIKSADNTISMYDTADNLRLQLNPSTTLPSFASPTNTTSIDSIGGLSIPYGTGNRKYYLTTTGNGIEYEYSTSTINISLTGALNEVYIDDLADRWYEPGTDPDTNMDNFFYHPPGAGIVLQAEYAMIGVLSGPSGTYEVVLGWARGDYNDVDYSWVNSSVYTNPAVFSNLAAGTYTFGIKHYFYATKILGGGIRWYPFPNSFDGTRPDGSTSSTINITYGTSTAYSVINAGGVVLYNGSRNIVKIAQPATSADSFFQVTGKSQFNTSLYVYGALAADSKQFQITHPLNEDKWLYHSAIEGPGAYLMYRGTSQLENGIASASIDLLSKMTPGTFENLVRRTQFFVQNNSSWDLVRGKVEGDVVYIESNNANSTASVDWMVIGERKDESILSSALYDNNGNYKPEKYKSSAFLRHANLETTSGSI